MSTYSPLRIRERWTNLPPWGMLVLLAATLLAGCSTVRDVADELPGMASSRQATLTGTAEVPGPGDPDGTGSAVVRFDVSEGEVCYDIAVSNIGPATAAHIHSGAAGQSGGPVINFNVAENGLESCVTGVDRDLMQQILDNPAAYYVNVHNETYPGGAVRGQLDD